MDAWKSEALKVVNLVLGNPSGQTEYCIVAAVGILALVVVMRFAASAAGITDIGWGRRILGLILGLGTMLAAEIAVDLYVLPKVNTPQFVSILRIGAPIAGAVAVGVPLQMFVLHARYGQALIAFAASAMASVLLMMGAKAMLGSVSAGSQETERLLKHQEETKELLQKMDH